MNVPEISYAISKLSVIDDTADGLLTQASNKERVDVAIGVR